MNTTTTTATEAATQAFTPSDIEALVNSFVDDAQSYNNLQTAETARNLFSNALFVWQNLPDVTITNVEHLNDLWKAAGEGEQWAVVTVERAASDIVVSLLLRKVAIESPDFLSTIPQWNPRNV